MIEKVISEVKLAEEESSEMISRANTLAKQQVVEAEIAADNKRKSTVKDLKMQTKTLISKTEQIAKKNRDKILEEGKEKAEKLYNEKLEKVDCLSKEIVENFLSKF